MNPIPTPPSTSRMGNGTRRVGASASRPPTATSSPNSSRSWWVPKCMPQPNRAGVACKLQRVPDTTVPIAYFETDEGAQQAVDILHANGIKCAVGEPGDATGYTGALITAELNRISVIVADEDEARGREAVAPLFAAKWWMTNAAGQRYLAFEVASADELRQHADNDDRLSDGPASELRRLAGLLDQHGWKHVGFGFHHAFRHDSKLEDRTLDEWAQACGCGASATE